MKRFLIALALAAFVASSPAQNVALYQFAQSAGTFTGVSVGATSIAMSSYDDALSGAQTLPFTFVYHGVSYTQFKMCTNGWLALGSGVTATGNYTPISSTTVGDFIAPFGRDLDGSAAMGTTYSWEATGSAPYRVATVQWTNVKKYSGTGDLMTFQAKLYETTNVVEFVYGSMTIGTSTTTYPQVGLRGATNADYANRAVTAANTWATSVAGTINTATCLVSSTVVPASGQKYAWTPVSFFGTGAATPSGVVAGDTILFTVAVSASAAPNPPTGVSVTGDFTALGGSAKPFADDGTGGDAVAGDNVFSYSYTVPVGTPVGSYLIPWTATDSALRTAAGNIAAAVTIPGDECTSALTVYSGVNPGAPSGSSGSFLSNVGATTSAGTMCATTTKDVWFSYTATLTGVYVISTCTPAGFTAGTVTDSVLAVYSACGGSYLACNDEYCASLSQVNVALTAGVNYLIRVGSWSSSAAGTFYLTINEPLPPPVNDTCANQIELFPGSTSATTGGATADGATTAGCTTFTATTTDIWYWISSPTLCTADLSITGSGANALAVYTGACGALVDAACGTSVQFSMAPGVVYLVRAGQTTAANVGPFSIAYTCAVPPPNGTLATATPVFVGVNPAAPLGVDGTMFTNVGELNALDTNGGTIPTPACGYTPNSDVFFSWYSTCNGPVTVNLCPVPGFLVYGTHTDTVLQVLDGSGATALACNDDFCAPGFGGSAYLSQASFTATYGQTYYFRVMTYGSKADGSFYLTVHPMAQLATIGVPCGNSLATLSGSNPPVIGQPGTISLVGDPNAAGIMFFSPPTNVYTDVGGGCMLYLANPGMMYLTMLFLDGSGHWDLSVVFPSDPFWVCTEVDLQAFVVGPMGFGLSNGLHLKFGY